MRGIDKIIIHCSATPPNLDIGAKEIRTWHKMDRGWSDIGYHYVVRRQGTIELGRPLAIAGAHARGHNANSIGICLVGGVDSTNQPEDNFTPPQLFTAKLLVRGLLVEFGDEVEVLGHRDLPGVTKDCPCFDVLAWLRS